MSKAYVVPVVAGAFLLGMATSALAVSGEYDNMCTMGLALGKEVKTDCSINETLDGKTYCFGNAEAKTMFLKDPKGNVAKAEAYRAKGGSSANEIIEKELQQENE